MKTITTTFEEIEKSYHDDWGVRELGEEKSGNFTVWKLRADNGSDAEYSITKTAFYSEGDPTSERTVLKGTLNEILVLEKIITDLKLLFESHKNQVKRPETHWKTP